MEYRKLIAFGKSSYVISLPKNWIEKNKLKKGDVVYLDENSGNLILQPNAEIVDTEKEIFISVDDKEKRRIQREIISAYIQNYKTITLTGNEIKDKAKEIQEFLQNLVALEIMEQDSKKIMAKDFLNLNDISVEQIVRKMDVIIKSMIKDCKKMFEEDNYENIYLRDHDVNKFRFLIFRIIWFGIENPTAVLKKLNLTQRDFFNYWWLSFSLEAIADYVKRIARYMKDIELNQKEKQEYLGMLNYVETKYGEIMKAYYTNNPELSHKVLSEKNETIEWFDKFHDRNRNTPLMGYLIHNTKSLIATVYIMGRIVYQGMPG